MISIRYASNEDKAEYPIQDSVHCRIRDGAFGLRYGMDTGDRPESRRIGTGQNIMPEKLFIGSSDGAGRKEYPVTLPAAELMAIMRNYETGQSVAGLCTEDFWR